MRTSLCSTAIEIRIARRFAFMREKDLQALARNRRGGAATPEQSENIHAALRPKSRTKSPLLSAGMFTGSFSPHSLFAASE